MYKIKLTNAELNSLAWAADRGYFPLKTYDALSMRESDREKSELMEEKGELTSRDNVHEFEYEIPEHAVWAILEQRQNDSHSLFACLGGKLLEKLLELEGKIV